MNTLFKKICTTNDINELFEIFEQKHKEKEIYFLEKYGEPYIDLFNERELVLFGSGMIGTYTAAKLKENGRKIAYFCDNNPSKWGNKIDGIEIKSPKYLANDRSNILVVVTVVQSEDICKQLDELNMNYLFYDIDGYAGTYNSPSLYHNKDKVLAAYELFEDDWSKKIFVEYLKARFFPLGNFGGNIFLKQCVTGTPYFDKYFFKYSNKEIMADVGAFNGDTIAEFVKIMLEDGKNMPSIYAFEPDDKNYSIIRKNMEYLGIDNYKLIKKLVSNADINSQTVRYNNCNDFIGNKNLEICKLDTELKDIPVTLIKVDVEGFEMEVLKGANQIIKTNMPKLAICIYHFTHDLFEIPLYIKEINPDYKMFLKIHENNLREIICYAY